MAICSSCGGSGIKRISEQRFRTCQDCLGRGEHKSDESSAKSTFSGHSAIHSLDQKLGQSAEVALRGAASSASAR